MSKTTVALEAAVAVVIENTPAGEVRQTVRQRANADKAFAHILKLIGPRMRHFIRQYGLAAHWEDAEQCCAIGVHRAIQAYEPEKAQFTTFVNWQLRGELQSLRFRLMTDQRPSAKKVEATTVSLNAISANADGDEGSLESMIEDTDALERTESAASDYFAGAARAALIDRYVEHLRSVGMEQLKRRARAKRATQPADPNLPRFRGSAALDAGELAELEEKVAQHRSVIERRLFDDATLDEVGNDVGVTKERVRQITKSAAKVMGELAASDARFAVMGSTHRLPSKPARTRKPAASPILLAADAAHNQFTRVVAIDPATIGGHTTMDLDLDVDAAADLPAPSGFVMRSKVLVD
ncbi:sigma factor-like helix-turn-helix DNA-binding protein [Sphingomonas aerophila]|uniref:RNA polymerase sigma-32 factor n=1 Tax=Sphingomonas aerophila TaxID=1344948 RepID=A0A7W9BAL4_9SPHN|nr:sigma factor-like helix-turn-helix DNA-binding protein [Sphingomonas aerophila]MBB5713667.1 RNA polymerase sigma-32 factor [Sphingomonas aerophila]